MYYYGVCRILGIFYLWTQICHIWGEIFLLIAFLITLASSALICFICKCKISTWAPPSWHKHPADAVNGKMYLHFSPNDNKLCWCFFDWLHIWSFSWIGLQVLSHGQMKFYICDSMFNPFSQQSLQNSNIAFPMEKISIWGSKYTLDHCPD